MFTIWKGSAHILPKFCWGLKTTSGYNFSFYLFIHEFTVHLKMCSDIITL